MVCSQIAGRSWTDSAGGHPLPNQKSLKKMEDAGLEFNKVSP
ncbi:hypothetical protein DW2_18709, partial [Thioclava atlantica]